ncbi:hypothetical protein CEXT_502921, partial [Caerostris extrusa]
VSGVLSNTGHSVAFRISDVQPSNPINISGGPLSYKYRFHELHLHYGRTDDRGSEHTLSGTAFPGEVYYVPLSVELTGGPQEARHLQKTDMCIKYKLYRKMQFGNFFGNLSTTSGTTVSRETVFRHPRKESSLCLAANGTCMLYHIAEGNPSFMLLRTPFLNTVRSGSYPLQR